MLPFWPFCCHPSRGPCCHPSSTCGLGWPSQFSMGRFVHAVNVHLRLPEWGGPCDCHSEVDLRYSGGLGVDALMLQEVVADLSLLCPEENCCDPHAM